MDIKGVLRGINFRSRDDLSGLRVNNLRDNSRDVREGDLFVAVRGYTMNGYAFIDEAIKNGARIVVSEKDFPSPKGVAKILVDDARRSLPIMADNFFGHPSEQLRVVGVTGTNGKTTVTYLIESILKSAGKPAGLIGTISHKLMDRQIPAKNTTPGTLDLQSMLAEILRQGAGYAVMEVSSHSLDQNRVERVYFDVGIFTNITSEHLDYHKTMDGYLKAKIRLFDRLKEGGLAVLNNDDKVISELKNRVKNKVMTYGIIEDADLRAKDIDMTLNGSSFTVVGSGHSFEIDTRLIGMHNVSNILAAIAASQALDIGIEAIKTGVRALEYVPGRLEAVDAGQGFKVFVDYAHTEDALYNVLRVLRGLAKRKIITVFGCGGNRDKAKRPLMGRAACKYSDRVIITSDNPRFEEPDQIIGQIELGVKGLFSNYEITQDRRSAIEKALALAGKDDIVFIAGKGHENYQIIKDKVLKFDDRETAREILKGLK